MIDIRLFANTGINNNKKLNLPNQLIKWKALIIGNFWGA